MKLLVPVDDSEVSLHAIDWVAALQRESVPIQVQLLNVRSPAEYYGAVSALDHAAVERALLEAQQQVLARALHHATRAGLQHVAVHTAQGLPPEAIVQAARAHGVDQIVMSTHGRGSLGALFLGSVAQRVTHLAPMPVTLVK
ncbi:MAG: universal stress protein [Burkholderiaceae bacterium]|nr:universal stress protein [Burkholderiaceae bacterium]